jgi:hypothetical protein
MSPAENICGCGWREAIAGLGFYEANIGRIDRAVGDYVEAEIVVANG